MQCSIKNVRCAKTYRIRRGQGLVTGLRPATRRGEVKLRPAAVETDIDVDELVERASTTLSKARDALAGVHGAQTQTCNV